MDNGDKIIQQFVRNDDQVLERTYLHNYKIVRSYVLKNNGSEADAKDVFQDAMMIAWMNLRDGKFVVKNEFSLQAYIYKIAKYKWIDKLKSKKMRLTNRIGDREFEDRDELQELNETENKINYLTELYSKLDDKCQDVLNRFYYRRNRLEEIADALNYDLGSVRTIKYRCMQKLRKMHLKQNKDW